MNSYKKIPIVIRITTISGSMRSLLRGQLAFMSKYYDILGVSSGYEILQEVAKKEGIRVKEVKMTRTISLLKDIRALWNLYCIIKNENPVSVHTHTPKAGILGMLAACLCKIPVRLHTVAGLPLTESKGIKKIILEIVEKVTYACATRVYPNSFGLRDLIIRNKYIDPSKLKVIGFGSSNGIDTNHFSVEMVNNFEINNIRKDFNINHKNFIFIFIGRLVSHKGINELVIAFEALFRKYTNVKLILVGAEEPTLDPIHIKTSILMKKHPAIIITGYQYDVRPFLALSNVLVFPSYREGLPNVPLQACAMNVPCIVTDINGCNEIIINEHNGLIIPAKNPEALQLAMERFLSDQELYSKCVSNSRASIIGKYNQLEIWNKIKEEYDSQMRTFYPG